MTTQNNSTLADTIAGILNTAPSSFDPEDDAVDATKAQVLQDVGETNEEEEILSKFRRANVDLLADLDEKYAGQKTSRKNLKDSDSESDLDIASDHKDSSEDDGSIGSETEQKLKSKQTDFESDELSSEVAESDDDQSEDDGDENDDDDDDDDGEDSSENGSVEDDTNFRHMTETSVSNQVKKGICVRNQMAMWENLLEVRIQLQKCVLTANKMPQKTTFMEIKKESGPEFSNIVNETKNKLCDTLDKLLLLQKLLMKQFPETKSLRQNGKNDDPDDEEIASDTDVELSGNEEEEVQTEAMKSKKRKLEEYENDLSDQHKKYKDYRNSVIQKWNDKTRVVLKGATSHSVLDQIEYNLSNKDKLMKRTQLKRSQYRVLGEEASVDKNEEEYNTEIFDDDDFYHQLLRELIEVKSVDVTDPVQLGRQWIQLQNLRSKMKRKIDTKATKGRKIRYAVHSKLVNFMAPIDQNLWTDEAKNELYNSLFGKNQPVFNA